MNMTANRMRAAGRPPAAQVCELEQALLNVAEDLFCRDGYHQVSIAAVANKARVATRTIYAKFGGKRGLLKAIIERDLLDCGKKIDAIAQSTTGVQDQLESLAHLMLIRACSERRVRLQADATAERYVELTELVNGTTSHYRRVLAGLLEQRAHSNADDCGKERLCDVFIGCILGRHVGALLGGGHPGIGSNCLKRMAVDSVNEFNKLFQSGGTRHDIARKRYDFPELCIRRNAGKFMI